MRRKDREIKDFAAACRIVENCEILRLGLTDGDLYPYIVPVNFGYETDGGQLRFYIHSAKAGRKYELMRQNGVCSFEMDGGHALFIDHETRNVTMHYQCLMGRASIEFLEEPEEKRRALDILMARDEHTRGYEYDLTPIPRTAVARLTVTEWTCKTNPGPKPE